MPQKNYAQMRILEHGHRMRIVKGNYGNLGVNTPAELDRVRSIVEARSKREGDRREAFTRTA